MDKALWELAQEYPTKYDQVKWYLIEFMQLVAIGIIMSAIGISLIVFGVSYHEWNLPV